MKVSRKFSLFVYLFVGVGCLPLSADGPAPIPREGPPPDLKPAEGNITWRLTYLADSMVADDAKPPKRVHRNVTVPINQVDVAGRAKIEFADLRCELFYSVEMATIGVFTAEDKLLYSRMFQDEPKNGIGDGFTGDNVVYHPTSGSMLKFSAFVGPGKEGKPAAVPKLTDKPRVKLTDFADEQIAAARKDPQFAAWSQARSIMTAKVKVLEQVVLTSSPPVYAYDLEITPQRILAGAVPRVKTFQSSYSVTRGKRPTFEDKTTYLLAIARPDNRVSVLAAADDAVADTACIAFHIHHGEQARLAKLAETKPAEHPLHKPLKEAEGVAIVRFDTSPTAGVEFHNLTMLEFRTYQVLLNLKGGLKTGAVTQIGLNETASQAVNDGETAYLVTYRREGKSWVVDLATPLDDLAVLVAADALGVKAETLQPHTKAARFASPEPPPLPGEKEADETPPAPGF